MLTVRTQPWRPRSRSVSKLESIGFAGPMRRAANVVGAAALGEAYEDESERDDEPGLADLADLAVG